MQHGKKTDSDTHRRIVWTI